MRTPILEPRRVPWRRLTALVLVMGLAASACGHASRPAAVETRANVARRPASSATTDLAVQATDALAATMYQRLVAQGGNVVFSPYSIELALAMTRTGARGTTRTQMDHVLGAPTGEALDASINALALALATRAGTRGDDGHHGQVALSTVDQLWGQKDLRFESPFLDLLAADYGAGLRPADFATDFEGARQEIDDWASQETHGRIIDLIPSGGLDSSTLPRAGQRALLQGAVGRGLRRPPVRPVHRPERGRQPGPDDHRR